MKKLLFSIIFFCLLSFTTLLANNNALSFDGIDDYVNCGRINPNTFTITAWVNPAWDSVLSTGQAFVSDLDEVLYKGFELHAYVDKRPVITIRNGNSWEDVIGPTAIPDSQWTHLAATFDGSTAKIYMNGILQATTENITATLSSDSLTIGDRSTGNHCFEGAIDEVGIWETALSQEEIISVLKSGLTGNEDNILVAYKFNQGVAGGNNPSIDYLNAQNDDLGNYTGTLMNFQYTGDTSNWVAGYNYDNVDTVVFISPNTITVADTANSASSFKIITDAKWSITSSESWLTYSDTSGNACDTIIVTAIKDNKTGFPREAIITITAADTIVKTISVIQETGYNAIVGDGTIENPYQITDIVDLCWLSATDSIWNDSLYFEQTADIDAAATRNTVDGKGFSPIGNLDSVFTGFYNGKGHAINNLFINRGDENYVGLFGFAGGAEIDSLGIANCEITGSQITGGLIGELYDSSSANNCYVSGVVKGSNSYVGGIVGVCSRSNLSSCFATSSVSCPNYKVGGISGLASRSNVTKCYSSGSVSGDHAVGGLVGDNYKSTVETSYFTGSATGGYNVGGLVGDCDYGNIANCYSVGLVVEDLTADLNGGVGGLVGMIYGDSLMNCFYNKETSLQDYSAGIFQQTYSRSVYGYTTYEMRKTSNFNGWDINTSSDWDIRPDSTYPALKTVDNAPFAFSDTITGSVEDLLRNDYDYETLQENLIIKIESAVLIESNVDYANNLSSLSDGDSLKIIYRVGEIRSEHNDTLWGGAVTSYLKIGDYNNSNNSSLQTIKGENLAIYPNPVSSCFTVDGFEGTATFYLYNSTGQLVNSQKVNSGESIDVSDLSKGMYVAKIQLSNSVVTKTIIVAE